MKFLKASFEGWIYCRDHQAECVNIVLKNGSLLGRGHQTWQMNEINALIWPNPRGIGLPPPGARRADREDREDLRRDQEPAEGRDELRVRREGGRAAEEGEGERHGRLVEEGDRQGDGGREVDEATEKGDPRCPY